MTKTAKRGAIGIGLCLVAIVLGVQPSLAGDDSVALITGATQGVIQGDSVLRDAPGGILVHAIGFALNNVVSISPGGGAGAGKTMADRFKLVKAPDKASPKLLQAAFTGETLTVEILWFMTDPVASGPTRRRTFSVKLEGAIITGIDISGDVITAGGVTEEIGLFYSKITFRDERSKPPVQVCIDIVGNKLC